MSQRVSDNELKFIKESRAKYPNNLISMKEFDNLVADLEEARRERDEARAELTQLREQREFWRGQTRLTDSALTNLDRRAETAERERDEARKEAERLREAIDPQGRLGDYLNTMVADCGLFNKGQYLRDLFGKFRDEFTVTEEKNEPT